MREQPTDYYEVETGVSDASKISQVREINRISAKEFREAGYLQEVNRQFLHPLGLALETVQNADGSETFGGVWDYRNDPEGMIFAGVPDRADYKIKKARVAAERLLHAVVRLLKFGWVEQP